MRSKHFFSQIIRGMLLAFLDKPLPPPTPEDLRFVEMLKSTCAQILPLLPDQDSTAIADLWLTESNRLLDLIINRDPREFLRWGLNVGDSFAMHLDRINPELQFLKSHPAWEKRWKAALFESTVGHPYPYVWYPQSSATLIHHAYHLAQFETRTKNMITSSQVVVEIGGGYGSLCRLFYWLGFKGQYIIYDLPVLSALQTFYLESSSLPVLSVDAGSTMNAIRCVSNWNELEFLVQQIGAKDNALFIATWSISEMPITLRNQLMTLSFHFQKFLIAYQEQFGDINNQVYFQQWTNKLPEYAWQNWQIDHLPGNRYLAGVRKMSG